MNDLSGRMIVPQNVTDALRSVIYPGSVQDIVTLHMVQEIRITGHKIIFSLVFPDPGDKAVPYVVAASEEAIIRHLGPRAEIKGNITVKGIKDMERPVLSGVKNIIAVASGKGGVGKSTVAVNLAVALANSGASVGLIDADIFGPSVPKMFGTENVQPAAKKEGNRDLIIPVEKYSVKFLSIGFFITPENALIWRGPMASNALKQLIADGDWGELEYLIVDLPPGTSDIHLTLVQTIPVTAAIIVTTPQDVALADALKGVNMFRSKSIDVPVLGLIENMSWFTPDELPESKYYIFGRDGGKKLAGELGVPLLGQIPLIQGIREDSDNGIPSAVKPETTTGKAFAELAKQVIRQLQIRNSRLEPTRKVKIISK